MTDMYLQLDYRGYKHLERQLLNWAKIETTHVSMDQRYYHKALRLEIGDLTLEIQGPAVREAVPTPAPSPSPAPRRINVRDIFGTCTCNKMDPDRCASCKNSIKFMADYMVPVTEEERIDAFFKGETITEETKDPCETPHAPHLCACLGTCTDCPNKGPTMREDKDCGNCIATCESCK